MSCALTGSAGTCTPVAAGGPIPPASARAQGAATCGSTGFCDGEGACQLYAAGTQCAAPTCPIGRRPRRSARTCDGAGVCKPAATQSLRPFACNAAPAPASRSAPPTPTASPGNVCNGGVLRAEAPRPVCAVGQRVRSGNCVDGVCCATASCGTCAACNVAGPPAPARPVPAGSTESARRLPRPRPPCGFDGTCDGSGGCRTVRGRDQLRRGVVHRVDRHAGRRAATAPAHCRRPTTSCDAVRLRRQRLPHRRAPPTPTASSATPVRAIRARTSSRTGPRAPRGANASAVTAPRGSAAAWARAPHATRARSPAIRGRAHRSPTAPSARPCSATAPIGCISPRPARPGAARRRRPVSTAHRMPATAWRSVQGKLYQRYRLRQEDRLRDPRLRSWHLRPMSAPAP